VAKSELGIKRVCPVTGRKFYDLNKDPVVSPYTGQSYPRSFFEPTARVSRKVAEEEEVEAEDTAGAELVSLEDVVVEEADKDIPETDDVEVEDDDADDTFLEEDEEDNDDVSGLIDGDIETDEEA
jgi:uncharacterized protein (TIGR02300 family)